jgi:hypothetical protein
VRVLGDDDFPAGDALVVRYGGLWAARLSAGGTEAVTVTMTGMGVAPQDVRLEALPDLRAAIMERYEDMVRRVAERRQNPPPRPPPPELPPAEGVAALREAAIDETLRHAMLGDAVPSAPAQVAWSRYWSAHLAGMWRERDSAAMWAEHESRLALDADWRAAWEAWTRLAPGTGEP